MSGTPEKNEFFEILVNKFTEESAKEFRKAFLSESEKNPVKPIIVWIDSMGGKVNALATMVETIESVPNEVVTACVGKAMSAGAILLSCGDKRYCGENSRIMIHECLVSIPHSNIHEVAVNSGEVLRQNRHWLSRLARNCGIKGGYKALKKMFKECEDNRTIYLNAPEALKFGIIDFIGIPQIKSETKYWVTLSPKKNR